MTGTPGWVWAAVVGVILGLLAVDLAAGRGQPTLRRATVVSAGWVAAAAAFGGILIAWRGGGAGQEYFTADLVEKALSIDNIFVFALLFEAFAVPAAYQHRVLFAGVAGALALRAGFIAAGATLLEHLAWAGYLFGALLIAAAVRMARALAPISSTPYFSSTPFSCSAMATLSAVWPPSVGSSASGFSRAITRSTHSGVTGSM